MLSPFKFKYKVVHATNKKENRMKDKVTNILVQHNFSVFTDSSPKAMAIPYSPEPVNGSYLENGHLQMQLN